MQTKSTTCRRQKRTSRSQTITTTQNTSVRTSLPLLVAVTFVSVPLCFTYLLHTTIFAHFVYVSHLVALEFLLCIFMLWKCTQSRIFFPTTNIHKKYPFPPKFRTIPHRQHNCFSHAFDQLLHAQNSKKFYPFFFAPNKFIL